MIVSGRKRITSNTLVNYYTLSDSNLPYWISATKRTAPTTQIRQIYLNNLTYTCLVRCEGIEVFKYLIVSLDIDPV